MYNGCDNVVGFLSQMGWTEGLGTEPSKKIPFEKIFIDIDTNAGNSEPSAHNHFHGKNQHRMAVMDKIWDYLYE